MSLNHIKDAIPDFARDIRLNVDSVLQESGAPGLNTQQIFLIALAAAHASRNRVFTRAMEAIAAAHLDAAHITAAYAAASVMAMNNIYYRFVHLVENAEYGKLPARLRMNVMANPGIDKIDFELASLAVSAINGCGMCMASHEKTLVKHAVSSEAIHSTARIASVIHAAAVVLEQADWQG